MRRNSRNSAISRISCFEIQIALGRSSFRSADFLLSAAFSSPCSPSNRSLSGAIVRLVYIILVIVQLVFCSILRHSSFSSLLNSLNMTLYSGEQPTNKTAIFNLFIALPAFLPNIPPGTALFHTSLWRPQRQHTDNAILPRQRL